MVGKANETKAVSRQALVVAGMHRSGTSAMARVLSLSGANLPEKVMDPGPDNPTGFWEPWEVVALDEEILAAVDSAWDNVFSLEDDARARASEAGFQGRARQILEHNWGARDLLVMKDPRSSLLTGFWRETLAEVDAKPVYVIMVRHPLEVAGSLLARDGFPREKSMLLWTSYMLAVERDTRDQPRVFVTYSDLLSDPNAVLDRIEGVLGRSLPRRTAAAGIEIQRFLSGSLRHHEALGADLGPQAWDGTRIVHDWMLAAARGDAASPAPLDSVRDDIARLERVAGPVLADTRLALLKSRAEHADVAEKLAQLQFRRDELAAELAASGDRFSAFHAETDQALQALRGEHHQAEAALVESRAEAAALKSQFDAYQAQTAKEVEALQAGFNTIHAESDLAVQAVKAELFVANEVLSESRAQIEAVSANLATLHAEADLARQEADLARQDIDLARQEAAYSRTLLEGETAKAELASVRLHEARQDAGRLRLDLESAGAEIAYHQLLLDGEKAKLDVLNERLHDAQLIEADNANLRAYIEALQGHVAGLQGEVQSFKTSTSWRVTRPLRSIIFRLRRLKG